MAPDDRLRRPGPAHGGGRPGGPPAVGCAIVSVPDPGVMEAEMKPSGEPLGATRRGRSVAVACGLGLLVLYVLLSFVNDPQGDAEHRRRRQDRHPPGHGGRGNAESRGRLLGGGVGPDGRAARPLLHVRRRREVRQRHDRPGASSSPARSSPSAATGPPCSGRCSARWPRRSPPVHSPRGRAPTSGGRWLAFWLTGLASPVAALRPRSLGARPRTGADGVGRRRHGRRGGAPTESLAALAAGLAFGAAFSMRTEAAAYGFVVVAVGCLLLWRRRGFVAALVAGAARRRSASSRWWWRTTSSRWRCWVPRCAPAGRRAPRGGGGSDLGMRLREAFTTTVGLFPSTADGALVVGIAGRWSCSGGRCGGPRARATGGSPASRRSAPSSCSCSGPWTVSGSCPGSSPPHRSRWSGWCWPGSTGWRHRPATPCSWSCFRSRSCGCSSTAGGRFRSGVVATCSRRGLVLAAVGIGASGLLDRWVQYMLVRAERRRSPCSVWPGCRYRTHEVGRARGDGRADRRSRRVGPGLLAAGARRRLRRADTPWLSVTGLGPSCRGPRRCWRRPVRSASSCSGSRTTRTPGPVRVAGWTAGRGHRGETWLGGRFPADASTHEDLIERPFVRLAAPICCPGGSARHPWCP